MPLPPTSASAHGSQPPVLLGPALNPINTTMIAVALVPVDQATGSTTDAGVHTLAWMVLALGLAGTLLTVADSALKGKDRND